MSKGCPSLFLLLTFVTLGHSSAVAQQAQIAWRSDLNTARQEAEQSGRNLLVHFWAPWCGPCRRLESTVFNQPNVAATLQQGLVPVKLNADEFPHVARAFGVDRLPTDVIVRPDGAMLAKFASPQDPMEYITQIASFTTPARSPRHTAEQLTAADRSQPSSTAGMQPAYANLNSPRAETVPLRSNPRSGSPTSLLAQGMFADSAAAERPWSGTAAAPAVTTPAGPYGIVPPAERSPIAGAGGNRYKSHAIQPAAGFPYPAVESSTGQTAGIPSTGIPPGARYSQPSSSAQSHNTPSYPPQSASLGQMQPPVVAQGGALGGIHSPVDAITPTAEENPSLGLEGFCPVTLKRNQQWVAGDKRFGIVHRGCLYLFAGPDEQQQFWSNPDHYSPVLSGIDPVLALDNGATVQGRREYGVEYNGLVYLFSSESTRQHFELNPDRYAGGVRQAMQPGRGTAIR